MDLRKINPLKQKRVKRRGEEDFSLMLYAIDPTPYFFNFAFRYRPVYDSPQAAMSRGVPAQTK